MSKSKTPLDAIPGNIRARLGSFYGENAVRYAEHRGVKVVVLRDGQKFSQVSGELSRLNIAVDAWPIPPAGLFVVAERTVYLRAVTDMTLAHEFAHALDCAAGGGYYLSGVDPRFRRAFASATAFVTPYAACAGDEFFAESVRAFVEANDEGSIWPRATKERLLKTSPEMYALVEAFMAEVSA